MWSARGRSPAPDRRSGRGARCPRSRGSTRGRARGGGTWRRRPRCARRTAATAPTSRRCTIPGWRTRSAPAAARGSGGCCRARRRCTGSRSRLRPGCRARYVTPGGERPSLGAPQHAVHVVARVELLERRPELPLHVVAHGVELVRPVEREHREMAVVLDVYLTVGHRWNLGQPSRAIEFRAAAGSSWSQPRTRGVRRCTTSTPRLDSVLARRAGGRRRSWAAPTAPTTPSATWSTTSEAWRWRSPPPRKEDGVNASPPPLGDRAAHRRLADPHPPRSRRPWPTRGRTRPHGTA